MNWYLEEIIVASFAVSHGLDSTRFTTIFLLYTHMESAQLLW